MGNPHFLTFFPSMSLVKCPGRRRYQQTRSLLANKIDRKYLLVLNVGNSMDWLKGKSTGNPKDVSIKYGAFL